MSEQPRHEDWCPCSQLIGAPMDDGESAEMGAFAWPADACVCGAVPVAPPLTAGPVAPPPEYGVIAHPFGDWHDDDGDVLWWSMPISEAPYVGSPLASDWPFEREDEAQLGWTRLNIPVRLGEAPRGAARPPQHAIEHVRHRSGCMSWGSDHPQEWRDGDEETCNCGARALVRYFEPASRPPASPPALEALRVAERIAREAHADQKEESTGDPYIRHIERVVALVDGDDAKTVAWLHDVIEDNPSWTCDRLEAEGIPPRLIRPVSLVTRRQPYTYADYIDDIATAGDPLAVVVKIADLQDHLRPNCPAARRQRYEKALARLLAVPPEAPPR